MSGTILDRSISMNFNGGVCTPDSSEVSSLQLFVHAKKKINEIYKNIRDYGEETKNFCLSLPSLIEAKDWSYKELEEYIRRIEAIQAALKRNTMKVVFFGRTSNGKSTAINALLGKRILPTGIGHTTSCFLQVEGGNENTPYILTEENTERKSMESISTLAHALCSESLDPNSLIRIFWPKERCKMLDEEVIIIDSPGIDVESDLDDWIDKYCLDSDVFVLVANAESTLMLSEKKFFYKVSERLSNPNIFILHNRSDAFSGEEMQNEVKQQHTERAIKFLLEELSVVQTKAEAEDRIFFVSAKEVLLARERESQNLPPNISTEDFFPRYLEFQKFEKKFTYTLSQTALKTKFGSHTLSGSSLVYNICGVLEGISQESSRHIEEQSSLKKQLSSELQFISRQLETITAEMKDKISNLTEDIEFKVGKAMSEEIIRLSALVDEFDDPFHPDPLVLNVYKSKLNRYIEKGIGSNLKSRLSSDLETNMQSHSSEMLNKMSALLPEERQKLSRNIFPRRETFEVLYHLNCDNLCSDFQEDIRFRFSLSLYSLIDKMYLGSKGPRVGSLSPNRAPDIFNTSSENWSLVSKVAVASVSSHGTMGGLLLGGLLLKTLGWKGIALTVLSYGGLYAYERLTWTSYAKCREFKKQYVEHAARKFRLIVDMTSANCSHQVQQELSSTFARLCHLVDETTREMNERIVSINETLKDLEGTFSQSKILRNQAGFISNALDIFTSSYIKNE